jgi:hypothetical protein
VSSSNLLLAITLTKVVLPTDMEPHKPIFIYFI